MDAMAQFLGSLGAYAAPVMGLRGEQGLAAPMASALGAAVGVDATQAMSTILRQYADLSAQGERLRQILVGGGTIPCTVWGAYNQACLDYLAKSQKVFDQLAQKAVTVEQVLYSGGQPVPDPNKPGSYKTLQIGAPLRPPAFGFVATQCPDTPLFQGATDGWLPTPVLDLGSIDMNTFASLGTSMLLMLSVSGNPLGAAGYGSYKTLKQIAVWMEDYDPPSQILAAFTDCVEKLTKSGLAPAAASAQCSNSQFAAQQFAKDRAEAASWGFWSWVGVGAAVLLTGGALALYLRHRVGRVLGPARLLAPGMAGVDAFGCGCSLAGAHRQRRAHRLGWG